ncbi:hypothetical protein LOCC1_G006042 [Lachnellula occidentalis]|uniref:DUF8035 domain-containing protein n=1 Tax=Lachnellula occidentalis TaxID=215460 RepID=A0A8H8RL75_9HELO|nr:hypothetical protein LOCC1_G006042 [Lachnellula occidentalis]
MSQYRSSAGDLGYRGRGGERWDSERFAMERDRERFGRGERDRFEERDTRIVTRGGGGGGGGGGGFGRPRERSVDEVYERDRFGPRGGYEDDRYERRERDYYDEPKFERERPPWERERERGPSITIEKEREREYYSPSPPPRRAPARPGILRRQSSLDTFDRKNTLARFHEREEYGPPARYNREQMRPPPLTPIPLPKTRALGPPPRRFEEREYYDEIKVAEPDFYGDEDFRGYPERVREREIIRRRRRSPSRSRSRSKERESRPARSVRGSVRGSSRSSSNDSYETVKNEFPKRGKTRMPGRLVDKRAIIDLGYPFEEEGETIIIMKALGRENIDEVIKLSEDYKVDKVEMHGGRSEAGNVYEEHRTEVFTIPAPAPAPPQIYAPPPPPPQEIDIRETTIIEQHRSPSPARSTRSHRSHSRSHHHGGPVIIDAGPRDESTLVERKREIIERSDPIPVGPLALALPAERHRSKDERSIRAEIKALEAEKEALRAEKRADKEMRKADRIRHKGHSSRTSETDLVIYDRERDRYERIDEDVTLVRRERVSEPEGGVRIEKDKKGRMSISVPKYA